MQACTKKQELMKKFLLFSQKFNFVLMVFQIQEDKRPENGSKVIFFHLKLFF